MRGTRVVADVCEIPDIDGARSPVRVKPGVAVALAVYWLVTWLVTACATGEQWAYDKKGVTPARLDRDLTACRQESQDPGAFALTIEQRLDRAGFNRCMERKGYSVRHIE